MPVCRLKRHTERPPQWFQPAASIKSAEPASKALCAGFISSALAGRPPPHGAMSLRADVSKHTATSELFAPPRTRQDADRSPG
jgi:hypothetical protein